MVKDATVEFLHGRYRGQIYASDDLRDRLEYRGLATWIDSLFNLVSTLVSRWHGQAYLRRHANLDILRRYQGAE